MRERVTRKQGCVYCHSVRLVIEVDGKIHERQKIEDQLREQALMEKGLKILGASLF
jgi:very-short-patch-repair endonuclease